METPTEVFVLESQETPLKPEVLVLRGFLLGGAIGLIVALGQQRLEAQDTAPVIIENPQPPGNSAPPEFTEFNGNIILADPDG